MKEYEYIFEFLNEQIFLLAEKALWFPKSEILLVSDVHLGKGTHFRKSGIPIPISLAQEDLAKLSDLIFYYHPKELIFLGDLFHSDLNDDWNWFSMWRQMHFNLKISLVKGNHDIIDTNFYKAVDIEVTEQLELDSFILLHKPPRHPKNKYVLCGHLHPGIKLKGKGRQFLTLSCFYFTKFYAVLPAFGVFTGNALINPTEEDNIFAIAGNKIVKM